MYFSSELDLKRIKIKAVNHNEGQEYAENSLPIPPNNNNNHKRKENNNNNKTNNSLDLSLPCTLQCTTRRYTHTVTVLTSNPQSMTPKLQQVASLF